MEFVFCLGVERNSKIHARDVFGSFQTASNEGVA